MKRWKYIRLVRREQGTTMIELMWYIALSLIVVGAAMAFLITTLSQQNVVASRAVAVRQAEVMLARLTREVRQAQHIVNTSGVNTTPVDVTYDGAGTSSLSFYLPSAGSTSAGTQVTWTCTANASCTRTAGGQTQTELGGITAATLTPIGANGSTLASDAANASPPVYPSSVDISLQVKDISQLDIHQASVAGGATQAITVQDGVALWSYDS